MSELTYLITCANGNQYVGSSVDPKYRVYDHMNALRKGEHRSPEMQADFNQLGEDSFTWELLPNETEYEATHRLKPVYNSEQDYGKQRGFSKVWATQGGEVREKLKIVANTDDQRRLRSERAKAQWADPAMRAKMSKGWYGSR